MTIVSRFPNGVPPGEIITALRIPISRRNVQHRLMLSCRGKVELRMPREKLALEYIDLPSEEEKDKNVSTIPLSSIAMEVQRKVSRPIIERTPVGYIRKFLDQYRPNVTSYLSESTCQRLLELGETDGEPPAGAYARQIFNRLLIDLSWSSGRLEGNTYSLLETERLLELK